jgi:MFS transporter, FSR family, fosmidomycin resistance protein
MLDRRAKLTIGLLSVGHFSADAYSSFLLPMLPVLAFKLRLTPARAGILVPTLMVTSSLCQPLYGLVSDRYLKRSMSVFGPLIAACFLSSIGVVTSLPALIAIIVLGGLGIGSFHPQSAAIVARVSRRQSAAAMSVFSSAGTIGVAFGPVLITSVVAAFGFERSYYTAGLGIAVWLLLLKYCPSLESDEGNLAHPPLGQALRAARGPLTLLYFSVVLRAAMHVSVQSYLPFLLEHEGLRLTQIGLVLSGFILFGGIGGLFGGSLADRFGARRVSMTSLLTAAPLLALAFLTIGEGVGALPWTSYALLAAGGTCLNVAVPINVVMAQRLVPGGASTVSALMMGFGWGAGALFAPFTGWLSQIIGFAPALTVLCVLPFVGGLLLLRYPADGLPASAVARQTIASPGITSEASGIAGD